MKKHFAVFRYSDQKVIPLYAPESTQGGAADIKGAPSPNDSFSKRFVDVTFSLAVLVLGLPFYLLVSTFIKLTSEGPVLFVQERAGRDGAPFKFYKFRTMTVDNSDSHHRDFTREFIKGQAMEGYDASGKPVFKMHRDPRVTSIGRFLRRTSLDELPQFINVLKGEMTLVGPRPPIIYELPHYKEWHRGRLAVRPGLTGLWQVSGRSTVPFDEMVTLDLYYIENWSLALDLKIITRTLPVMLLGTGGY